MREPERETFYLVGTPQGKINQHEKKWLDLPRQKVRDSVLVPPFPNPGAIQLGRPALLPGHGILAAANAAVIMSVDRPRRRCVHDVAPRIG
jgi:hypothetical protein